MLPELSSTSGFILLGLALGFSLCLVFLMMFRGGGHWPLEPLGGWEGGMVNGS